MRSEAGVRQMTAVDLFAGAGGASAGLHRAGFTVLAAIESDPAAARSYAHNHPETRLYDADIRRIQAPALARRLQKGVRLDLLTACPPCQGFSTLGRRDKDDERNNLIGSLARFVRALRPRAILLENVPGLAADRRMARLERVLMQDYVVARWLIDAAEFGVPQRRRRLIVIAIERPFDPEHLAVPLKTLLPRGFDVRPRTAGPAIAAAGPLGGGDPVHQARRSTQLTLERIDAMPVGGGRSDLPVRLRLACHDRLSGKHATSIYGRIDPDRPAPAMTTRCTTPSCGRFVHPSERRGLSLREAALLQTFPKDYVFEGAYGEIERQIGNAVPVKLAEALGHIVRDILTQRPTSTDGTNDTAVLGQRHS
jgi:DNA (cytosine-5)-methyltransferase 1